MPDEIAAHSAFLAKMCLRRGLPSHGLDGKQDVTFQLNSIILNFLVNTHIGRIDGNTKSIIVSENCVKLIVKANLNF